MVRPFDGNAGDVTTERRATFQHLYDIVTHRAAAYPTAIALGGQQGLAWKTLTSAHLLDLVDRLAIELTEQGVREGDRIVLWLPSHWRTPVYLFALWRLGAIVVPFDHEMNAEAAAAIQESVDPRLIISGFGERPTWMDNREILDWWEPGSKSRPSNVETAWQRPTEELAAIFFTSGTTGKPKGCMITHANLLSQVEALPDNFGLDPSCRLASILPLSHLFEMTCGLLYPLAQGAAIHYIPSRRGPDIIRVLAEQRITHMVAVPQLLAMMGQALDKQLQTSLPRPAYLLLNAIAARVTLRTRHRLFWLAHRRLGGHLRTFASGGAALPATTQRFWERLGVQVVQGYGASECSPVIACGNADGSTPIGTVGRPIRGVEVKLSSEGELLVRGPNVMRGYWKDPVRTAEVIRDGWYATGDLAAIDGRGNVRLNGRARDLIVLPSGMKVWPQDVEDVLRSHPLVRDAVVMAVLSPSGGTRLHAYLIPAAPGESESNLTQVIAQSNGRLAQHQRVATGAWWTEADFPRTPTLKVRRNLIPPPSDQQAVSVDSVLAADDPVGAVIRGVTRVKPVQAHQTLAELGLDSLGLVDLALALEEKTGKTIGDGDLRLELTVEGVRALVAASRSNESKAIEVSDRGGEQVSAEVPLWPYTWGRVFRIFAAPFGLVYRLSVTQTIVLGSEHLSSLTKPVIFAGTHHGFADMPLVRRGIARSPARKLGGRLVIATAAKNWDDAPWFTRFVTLAFGLYPLRQRGERDASLRGLARLCERGNALLIFPQGHHSRPEQERAGERIAAFQSGVGFLASALDATVVPFGVAGTEKVLKSGPADSGGITIGNIAVSLHRGPLAISFAAPVKMRSDESSHAFAARLQGICFAATAEAERALAAR